MPYSSPSMPDSFVNQDQDPRPPEFIPNPGPPMQVPSTLPEEPVAPPMYPATSPEHPHPETIPGSEPETEPYQPFEM